MKTTTINVRLEHRPALRMCSLVIESDPETCSSIFIQESVIRLSEVETGSCINLKLEGDYSIDLTTLSDWNTLIWKQTESSSEWVAADVLSSETIRLRLTSQPEDKAPKRSVEVLPEKSRYGLHCRRCQLPLTNENWTSKRVLPLPSENWRSSQDMWFCHKHGEPLADEDRKSHADDPTRKKTAGSPEGESPSTNCESKLLTRDLLPRLEDLYYSNTKLLVHSSAICSNSAVGAGCRSITCRGCNNIIGQCDTEISVYFYRMNVDLLDTNTSRVINRRTPLNLLAKLVREQIAHGGAHCRLILSSESSGDALLVWVLESDILVFREELRVPQSEKIERNVIFDQCHQVLFRCTQRSAPIVQAWSTEFSVSSESILQTTLDTLRDHLVDSKRIFAKYGRDDSFDPTFAVGCIPAL